MPSNTSRDLSKPPYKATRYTFFQERMLSNYMESGDRPEETNNHSYCAQESTTINSAEQGESCSR